MFRPVNFAKDVVNGWLEADAFRLAAALAYYAIFSIAPLLLISIHIAALFMDRGAAVTGLTGEFANVIGPAGSGAIQEMLQAAGTSQPEGWAGLVGLGVLLFAAAGFVGSLQDALDTIWDAPPSQGGLWAFVRSKFLSFSLVLAAAFLLLISLVLSSIVTAFSGSLADQFDLPEPIVTTVVFAINFVMTALVFTLIFKYVPRAYVAWSAALGAGLFTAVLFALGRYALAWYLSREAQASAYGAATSLVLLLVWVYYSAQILFLGAQFSQSLQNYEGSSRRRSQ
jgi:membrane protein